MHQRSRPSIDRWHDTTDTHPDPTRPARPAPPKKTDRVAPASAAETARRHRRSARTHGRQQHARPESRLERSEAPPGPRRLRSFSFCSCTSHPRFKGGSETQIYKFFLITILLPSESIWMIVITIFHFLFTISWKMVIVIIFWTITIQRSRMVILSRKRNWS